MALFSELITNIPFGLLVFFVPLIYLLHIRSFHRFCEMNMNEQLSNTIKFLTPIPSELTLRTVIMSYSFLLTMITFEITISFIMLIITFLF